MLGHGAEPPTQDERTMATLAYALTVAVGFWAPLVIYLVRGNTSRFVAFHAVQSLALSALAAVAMVVSVILFVVAAVVSAGPAGPAAAGGLVLLAAAVFGVVSIGHTLAMVMYAVKASRGEWAPMPVVGDWARRTAEK